MMSLSIISIGNELLNGKTVNSNASFIGRECTKIGLSPIRILTVSDEKNSLVNAFDYCLQDSTIVICSGGLGPTSDDFTRSIVAAYFNDNLELDKNELTKITARFKEFGRTLSERNKKQAEYPSKAKLFNNNFGTASGFLMRKKNTAFYFLPGVPYEMKHLLTEQIIPSIQKGRQDIVNTSYLLYRVVNVPESSLNEFLEELITANQHLEFAFYPNFLCVDVYIRGEGASLKEIEPELNLILLEHSYSRDEKKDLVDVILYELKKKKKKVSFAESCTGGLLSAAIVEKSGASEVFRASYIVYDNKMKEQELAVSKETLSKYGAVSTKCVEEMALGCAKRAKTDYALSISGIAGPSGGTEEKPVGTVCFGLASPNAVSSNVRKLGTQRELVQKRAVSYALFLLWKELINN
jgi:nicotinamide-nucleotide amidase